MRGPRHLHRRRDRHAPPKGPRHPTRTFIEKVRFLPFLCGKGKWKGEISANHYDAFKKGPPYGYLQFLNETAQEKPILGDDPGRKSQFLSGLIDKVNGMAGADAVKRTSSDMPGLNRDIASSAASLPDDVQRKVLDQIAANPSAMGTDFEQTLRTAAPETAAGFRRYGDGIGKPVLAARDALQYAETGLGAAEAGLGIYALIQKFRERSRRKKEQEALDATLGENPEATA